MVNSMSNDIADLLSKIVGQPCSRREAGRMGSLSLGFGDRELANPQRSSRDYRSWEFGTYDNVWRVVKGPVILLSNQNVDDLAELNRALESIEFGAFSSIKQLSELDVRVELDNGVAVDFIGTNSDEDEYFHVFCPEKLCIEFSQAGWIMGRSDKPWGEATCA